MQNLDKIFWITFLLVGFDIIFLKLMFSFYHYLGITINRKIIKIKPDKTIKDICVYLGISEDLVYKVYGNNKLIFRSKFSYMRLRSIIYNLSIIKGDIKIVDNNAIITQRLNLTTVYFILMWITLAIVAPIDLLGYILAVISILIFILIAIVTNIDSVKKINDICKSIETHINQEHAKSQWPDH